MSRFKVITVCSLSSKAVACLTALSLLSLLSGCRTADAISRRPVSGRAEIQDRLSDRVTSTAEKKNDTADRKTGDGKVITTAYDVPRAPDAGINDPREELPALPPTPDPLPGAPSAGEPADESASALTLASLEQMALQFNPTIAQAGTLVRQQEGTTVQAGLYPNPQAGYIRSDPDQSGQSRTSGVFLSQTFITGGKLRLAQQASQYDVTLRSWQLDAQKRRVVNDVRVRFYEVHGAQDSLVAAQELEKEAADGVRIAKELVEAQRAGRPDLLQAEMQLTLARGAVKDAQLRLKAGRRQLASLVGVPALSWRRPRRFFGRLHPGPRMGKQFATAAQRKPAVEVPGGGTPGCADRSPDGSQAGDTGPERASRRAAGLGDELQFRQHPGGAAGAGIQSQSGERDSGGGVSHAAAQGV